MKFKDVSLMKYLVTSKNKITHKRCILVVPTKRETHIFLRANRTHITYFGSLNDVPVAAGHAEAIQPMTDSGSDEPIQKRVFFRADNGPSGPSGLPQTFPRFGDTRRMTKSDRT